jgi:hypothetical protein
MEFCLGTPAAAALIYQASDPKLEKIPDFYATNEAALEDMWRLAGRQPPHRPRGSRAPVTGAGKQRRDAKK